MNSSYDRHAQTLSHEDLLFLYGDVIAWENAGHLVSEDGPLGKFEEAGRGPHIGIPRVMQLLDASNAVYREIARRSIDHLRSLVLTGQHATDPEQWPDEDDDPEPPHDEVCKRESHRWNEVAGWEKLPKCPRCDGFALIDAVDHVLSQPHDDRYLTSEDVLMEIRLWLGQSVFPEATAVDVDEAVGLLMNGYF